MDYERVLEQVVAWAGANDNVRAVVLTGSAARGPEMVHPESDRDLEIYADQPHELLDDESWFADLGTVLVVERLPNPGWHPTRLVYYADGKLDFTVAPTSALQSASYSRAFRVLLDKDGLTRELRIVRARPRALPAQGEFDE